MLNLEKERQYIRHILEAIDYGDNIYDHFKTLKTLDTTNTMIKHQIENKNQQIQ